MRLWQHELHDAVCASLPAGAAVRLHGSAADPATMDGWSDLDLIVSLDRLVRIVDVVPPEAVWAFHDVDSDGTQVCRLVLTDGRRLDLTVTGRGRIVTPEAMADNEFRFIAAMVAVKLGRCDRLIGGHLLLELLRMCLVEAMLLRDHDQGTSVHRRGSRLDAYADDIMAVAARPLDVGTRPCVVERAAELYGELRSRREPGYAPDWSGLGALINRGLGS